MTVTRSLIRRLTRPYLGGLTLYAALSTFWIGLGLAAFLGLNTLADNWSQRHTLSTLIVLSSDAPKDTHALLHALSVTHGASDVQILSPADTNALLSQWNAPWPDPVPQIIILRYTADTSTLKHIVTPFCPGATIIAPPQQNGAAPAFISIFRFSALISALIGTVSGVLVFIVGLASSLRSSYRAQHAHFFTLYYLGCPVRRLYARTVMRAVLLSFVGGWLGILIAVPALRFLLHVTGPLLHTSLPPEFIATPFIPPTPMSLLYTVPCLQAVYGWAASTLFYRAQIRALS